MSASSGWAIGEEGWHRATETDRAGQGFSRTINGLATKKADNFINCPKILSITGFRQRFDPPAPAAGRLISKSMAC
jgi:hypothetical protein